MKYKGCIKCKHVTKCQDCEELIHKCDDCYDKNASVTLKKLIQTLSECGIVLPDNLEEEIEIKEFFDEFKTKHHKRYELDEVHHDDIFN